MAQRSLAVGGLAAGGMMLLGSGSQGFLSAPVTAGSRSLRGADIASA
eukprot:CAMPEP_0197626608 /NCGR_PEP_ID=MMETSP1338-20131121/5494_1 /TAXON_ID=43686 ORGANISM="Pelagodinium beii, Strain RCC1491" /NCGR_SAMPLE_ID=MMETSP1338 /ASSEMBLY_ACC=CAM_ASM_000754 /LENGTH=46 /DNA_ID= /DNA_START= /DNA_END= /DNA_ORIENTATION=